MEGSELHGLEDYVLGKQGCFPILRVHELEKSIPEGKQIRIRAGFEPRIRIFDPQFCESMQHDFEVARFIDRLRCEKNLGLMVRCEADHSARAIESRDFAHAIRGERRDQRLAFRFLEVGKGGRRVDAVGMSVQVAFDRLKPELEGVDLLEERIMISGVDLDTLESHDVAPPD